MSGRRVPRGMDVLQNLLHYDFCPGANRWVYWLKNPFWVILAAALTAVISGLFVSLSLLVCGASLAGLLLLGSVWPVLTIRGVGAELRFRQARCREGEPAAVELLVQNRWPWPIWGLRVTQVADGCDAQAFDVASVNGWSTVRLPVVFRPERRGCYPTAEPRIESAFPFGLYVARRPLARWNQLIVWPARAVLANLPDAVEIESREDRASDRQAGDAGDVLGTRAFRSGDSLRRVHWAQSARQGRLIVCERQRPISCALRVLLDLEPAQHGGAGREASLERLLRVAASMVESLHAQHALVECRIGSELFSVGPAAADLRRCLDALATVPREGLPACAEHGLCCATTRHRALSEFLLTTPRGFAANLHGRHWSGNHHYIVVGAAGLAASGPPAPCACRPWLELRAEEDVLTHLPRRWQRACRVA